MHRQRDGECRARARFAREIDRSTVSLDDTAHDPQTNTKTAIIPLRDGSFETFEDARAILLPYADPAIDDTQFDVRSLSLHFDLNGLLRPILDGIAQEIAHGLIE